MGKIKINKMPTKKILEEFLEGMFKTPTIVFNMKEGKFEKEEKQSNNIKR